MHLFLKKIYRKNPFPKIYRINQCEVLIEAVIGKVNTNIKVESATGLDITFKGDEALSFAFTCLQTQIDPAGRISLSPANNFKEVFRSLASKYEQQLLSEEIEMLEWD